MNDNIYMVWVSHVGFRNPIQDGQDMWFSPTSPKLLEPAPEYRSQFRIFGLVALAEEYRTGLQQRLDKGLALDPDSAADFSGPVPIWRANLAVVVPTPLGI